MKKLALALALTFAVLGGVVAVSVTAPVATCNGPGWLIRSPR